MYRDVWNDELVVDTVRASYVLYYKDVVHPDGNEFVRRYSVKDLPYVGRYMYILCVMNSTAYI